MKDNVGDFFWQQALLSWLWFVGGDRIVLFGGGGGGGGGVSRGE